MKEKLIRSRYKIIREISRGGMGVVFLALDLLKDRQVAVKKSFYSGDEKSHKGFEIEAKLLARLDHDGLPKVRDYFFLEEKSQVLVMDYIKGETLQDILDSGKFRVGRGLNPLKVLEWTDQILKILIYLHNFEPPIIHRDIKPNNIKLTGEGKIILLDFGLAKSTFNTILNGRSGYSPIEQVHCAGTNPSSDIYALGTTIFHLLTDDYPMTAAVRFEAVFGRSFLSDSKNPKAISLKEDPQKSVQEFNPQVPKMVSEIVMKAMALMPEDRFQTAEEMLVEVTKAKRSLEYGINQAGLFTKLEISTISEKRPGPIKADEESISKWSEKKSDENDIYQKSTSISLQDSINPVKTVSSDTYFRENPESQNLIITTSNHSLVRENSESEFSPSSIPSFDLSFELPEKKPPETKKQFPVFLSSLILLLILTLLGISVWYFPATPKIPAQETVQTNISNEPIPPPKPEEEKEIPLQITKYKIGKNGKVFPLEENYQFAENEPFKFGITAPKDGFLYIVSRNNQDKAVLAYPYPNQKDNFIKKDTEKIFPQAVNFELRKSTPDETFVYFVIVASPEDDLAKRIGKNLDPKEKSLSNIELKELFADLDKLADDSANQPIVRIVKILKR